MSINIFSLEFCQPLVWLALTLVMFLAVPNILLYSEMSGFHYLEEKKSLRIYNWILSIAVLALWAIVVIANHQTVEQDLINFVFLVGFSIVFAVIAMILFVLLIALLVAIILETYYLFISIKALFNKR